MSVAHPPSKLATEVIYDCRCGPSRGNLRPFARERLKPMQSSSILLALSIGECQLRVREHAILWRDSVKFRPLQDRVLVRRIEEEEKTKGGIIIPDTAKEKPQEGEVIAVGPGARDESG